MYYRDVLLDIIKQLGDPDADRLLARSKDHLNRAIFDIIRSENFNKDDVPGYVKRVTDLSLASVPLNLSQYKILKPLDIFPDPETPLTSPIITKLKTLDEIRNCASKKELQPTEEDVDLRTI